MRLTTLGRPHVVALHDGQEIALQPLSVAFLVYLAAGGPRSRDHLADLFWRNSRNALNSLSTTLNRIRALAPGAIWVQGNTLVGTDLPSDIGDLRDAIDRADFESVSRLYVAPFLGNLRLRKKCAEFEEWVLEERATLASMIELVMLRRGRDLYSAGEYQGAAISAENAWEIAIRDGFPSPDNFEVYHRILASAARPSATAVRTMAEEFGIKLPLVEVTGPVNDTSAVAATRVPASTLQNSRENVDTTTQFFGCEEELSAIASSVGSHRLTTVVGLGGSGKTRLAAEYFQSSTAAQDFPHRYWINLRDATDHDAPVAPRSHQLGAATLLGRRGRFPHPNASEDVPGTSSLNNLTVPRLTDMLLVKVFTRGRHGASTGSCGRCGVRRATSRR